ncbi:MAG TPA: hypothetical protein VFB46_06535 [Gemmatimonadaceae bacterium]|nr:hypothetical protein [Gemmatimonadaceae bacterium]
MSRIEEMVAVRAAVPQAMRHLLTIDRMRDWIAPDMALLPRNASPTLSPGDRFRLEALGTVGFDYTVEAISDREVVLSFDGPWSGSERWSFVADGAETIVRRAYDVNDDSATGLTAWMTVGRPLVLAHYKYELSRYREAVERDPGPRAEIEGRTPHRLDFPVDEG